MTMVHTFLKKLHTCYLARYCRAMASRRHKDLKAAVKQGLKAAVKGGRRNIHKLVAQGENADIQLLAGELERDKGGK